MGLRNYLFGFLSALALFGCAGAAFPYKYYGLDANSYQGFLRGPEPKDDLDLAKECTPTQSDAAPCAVFKTSVVMRMKLDYKDIQNRLKACESK